MPTKRGLTASRIKLEELACSCALTGLIHGNPGVFRNLTEDVAELKIDEGPGYRVYYSIRGDQLLLLLTGGSKSTQSNDIAKALELNRQFLNYFQ